MTYSLKLWTHPTNENDVRVYINGTTRQAVYFTQSKAKADRIVWSSKTKDTPTKFQSGNHYGKVRKDGDAAHEVAEAFGIVLGPDGAESAWLDLISLARTGIEIDPYAADADDGEA